MLFTPSSKTTELNFLQSSKADSGTKESDPGILISPFSSPHPLNAQIPILRKVEGKTTLDNERQNRKAADAISSNPSGKTTEVRLSQFSNAEEPILFKDFGKVISFSRSRLPKTSVCSYPHRASPNSVTGSPPRVSGTTTDSGSSPENPSRTAPSPSLFSFHFHSNFTSHTKLSRTPMGRLTIKVRSSKDLYLTTVFSGRTTTARFLQFRNAFERISFKESGKETSTSSSQYEKASSPIYSTPSPKTTERSFRQLEKARC